MCCEFELKDGFLILVEREGCCVGGVGERSYRVWVVGGEWMVLEMEIVDMRMKLLV